MSGFRHCLRGHRAVVALLVLLALAARLVVPAGFMPGMTRAGVRIVLCPSAGALPVALVQTLPGMDHSHHHDGAAKGDTDCPFAGLAVPSLGGADAVQLAALFVAILGSGLLPVAAWPGRAPAHLRPPLRGPPALG